MPDFSVRLKNLPDQSTYNKNPEELAAQLEQHIHNVVIHERQIMKKKKSDDPSKDIEANEIVSINFAQKNFEKYRVLLRIDALAKQGRS